VQEQPNIRHNHSHRGNNHRAIQMNDMVRVLMQLEKQILTIMLIVIFS
jgi:hypothetical protein